MKKKVLKDKSYFYENNFYLHSEISRISKFVVHYEIYKKISKIKGDIFEFGVFKGSSLIRFLSFINLFEKKRKKKVFAFDAFGKFPKSTINEDNKFANLHDKNIGYGISKKKLEKFLQKKNINNFHLIKGNINDTLPYFLKKNKKIKISLLHLDVDVYEPTKLIMEMLFKKISKNGIVLIDDYQHISGATKAINVFLKKNKGYHIEKFKFKSRPSYIVKKIK